MAISPDLWDLVRSCAGDLSGIDPDTDALVALFNPRTQRWADHFVLRGRTVVGLTATGRTTVGVLAMNTPARQALRNPHGPGTP